MITIYDIAKKCGVSPSTVSKAINNYSSIPEETKIKVQKAMEEMNYIPNIGAKFLSKGSSNNVGILAYFGLDISAFNHPLFSDILDSFQKTMNAKQYDLLFISRNVAGKNETFYRNCVSRNVDGVLLFGDMENEEMKEIINSEIPRVGFDYFGNNMTSVVSNNYQAMFQLTEHLIFFGHKNIVYIHGDDNDVTTIRINAFKDALIKHHIEFHDDMIVGSKFILHGNISNITNEIMSRQYRPTAIMYPDDFSAIEGIKALKEMHLNIPSDISVTGFDGLYAGQLVTPRLTTFKQDVKVIGKVLAEELIQAMGKNKKTPERIEVLGSLIIGDSTGNVPF